MNQSKINAGGINQQPMDAVSAAIANSININLQSIFKQYTKRQHPMNAKLTSVHSASTSMRRVVTAIAQSINIQCALNQHPMRIASDSLMPGFSSPKTFTLSSMPLTPCHSARSRRRSRRIHLPRKYPFLRCVEGPSLKTPLPLREK